MSLMGKSTRALRAVAIFEAAKGLLVLVVGFGLLVFDKSQWHHAGEKLVRLFHLNPAHEHPHVFKHLLASLDDSRLRLLACGALAYAVFRFVEAYGLWRARHWAEWLALISGAAYIPFEIYEVIHTRGQWATVTLLVVNSVIVAVIAAQLRANQRAKMGAGTKNGDATPER